MVDPPWPLRKGSTPNPSLFLSNCRDFRLRKSQCAFHIGDREVTHTHRHFQTRERRIKERDYFFMGLGLCSLSSNLTQNRPLRSTFGKICGAGVPETLLIFHLADLLLWFRVCLGLIQSLQGKNRECLLWAFKSEQCARSKTLVAVTDVLACK